MPIRSALSVSPRSTRLAHWLRTWALPRQWSGRFDPQRRLLVVTFLLATVLTLCAGVTVALVLEGQVRSRTETLAASLMATAVRGHLQPPGTGGGSLPTAPPATAASWWRSFDGHLSTMLEARDVDVLDSDGVVVFGDEAGEVGRRALPAATLVRIRAGQVAHLVRADLNDPSRVAFLIGVPLAFVASDGTRAGTGAVLISVDAAPIVAAATYVRNRALAGTFAMLALMLAMLWFLIRRLAIRAYRDPLTRLPNRQHFMDFSARLLAQHQRYDRPAAVLYFDVNRLGDVNASLGQPAGDAVLRSVARALRRRARAGDALARVSGDAFALFLNEVSAHQARLAAESFARELETSVTFEQRRVRIAASVGVATFPQDGTNVPELLQHAEDAMRFAKEHHFSLFVYEPVDPRATGEILSLEADLRDALLARELEVHYQPIVRAHDAHPSAYEALARWPRPSGPISPGIFIPIAERTGLIRHLDRFVYESALRDVAAATVPSDAENRPHVGINLSAASLSDPDTPEFLRAVAEDHRVPFDCITLEVTETSAIENLRQVQAVLTALRTIGFRIALDDFGIGYSSLAHLRKLPIDVVKIDRQFVQGIGQEASDEMLVQSVIGYARTLSLRTVAEGVETEAQHRWLQAAGVDYEQGYLHGRPAPGLPARVAVATSD